MKRVENENYKIGYLHHNTSCNNITSSKAQLLKIGYIHSVLFSKLHIRENHNHIYILHKIMVATRRGPNDGRDNKKIDLWCDNERTKWLLRQREDYIVVVIAVKGPNRGWGGGTTKGLTKVVVVVVKGLLIKICSIKTVYILLFCVLAPFLSLLATNEWC